MVSTEIIEKILNYIEERRGIAIVNDIVRLVDGQLSKPSTLKLIEDLESEHKINIRKGRKGQRHYLSINDKNQFNKIRKEIFVLENFIKEMNLYLRRRDEENDKEIEKGIESKKVNNEKASEMDNRIPFINSLYYHYYEAFKRILDNLFRVTTMSDISKEDSEIFLKEIIELKSKLKYLSWSKEDEKRLFKTHINNINNIVRKFERNGLEDYIEEKGIKTKFAEPIILKINDFVTEFLN